MDYIYLDTDERRRFAQVSHEYLIEQLQFTGDESTSQETNKIKLNFNHPCKELIWVVQRDENVSDTAPVGKQWFNYTDAYDFTYKAAGGQDVSGAFSASYSNLVTPSTATNDREAGSMPGIAAGGANNVYVPVSFENGTNPVVLAKLQLNGHDRFSERDGRYFNLVQPYQHHENVPSQGINVYSFGLKPEEHQPSGTCNMSRIDNATLHLKLSPEAIGGSVKSCKVRVYAVNYNVLRIMSGMGGLNARAEKLWNVVNWALTACKLLMPPVKWQIASRLYNLQHLLLIGKLLRTSSTKGVSERTIWPRVKDLGKVIMMKIGQPACLLPNGVIADAYGGASETERRWVNNEGQGGLSWLKIQSIHPWKLGCSKEHTPTKRNGSISQIGKKLWDNVRGCMNMVYFYKDSCNRIT